MTRYARPARLTAFLGGAEGTAMLKRLSSLRAARSKGIFPIESRTARLPVSRFLLTVVCFFFGIAQVAAQPAPLINYWNVDKLLSLNADELELTDDKGNVLGKIEHKRLSVLNEIRKRIEKSSGIRSDFYIVTGEKPNAFATNIITGRNLFAINLPMIEELGLDTDAMAALMGHELAHIERNHIAQKMQAAQEIQVGAQVATVLLALAGVRYAGSLSSAGATFLFGGYSRNQEREADSSGLRFAANAGFNPYGGVRLFSRMSEKHGDKWNSFLSTHPSHSERIELMREKIAASNLGSASETQITNVDVPMQPHAQARVAVRGEYRATVFDAEERSPTLHQKISCKLPDGSEVRTTRLDCVQQEGAVKK